MQRLSGKLALVTGGSSGIGLAITRAFLEEGARVAIVSRDEAKLCRARETLSSSERLASFRADVADPAQVQALVEDVTRSQGAVDILVNNAGLNIKHRTLRELTPETWQLLLR